MNKYAELLRRAANITRRCIEDGHTLYKRDADEFESAATEIESAQPIAWETTSGDFVRNDGNKYNEHWEPVYKHPAFSDAKPIHQVRNKITKPALWWDTTKEDAEKLASKLPDVYECRVLYTVPLAEVQK